MAKPVSIIMISSPKAHQLDNYWHWNSLKLLQIVNGILTSCKLGNSEIISKKIKVKCWCSNPFTNNNLSLTLLFLALLHDLCPFLCDWKVNLSCIIRSEVSLLLPNLPSSFTEISVNLEDHSLVKNRYVPGDK